jgi:hypothetical protein
LGEEQARLSPGFLQENARYFHAGALMASSSAQVFVNFRYLPATEPDTLPP